MNRLKIGILKNLKPLKCYSAQLGLSLLLPSLVFAKPFYEAHRDGWFWYQDAPLDTKDPEKIKASNDSVLLLNSQNPTQTMQAFRQKVEDSLNLAILSPTPENLKNYAAQ